MQLVFGSRISLSISVLCGRGFQLSLALVAGGRHQRLADFAQPSFAGHLGSQRIGHVECIGRPFAIGGDMRRLNDEVGLEQGVGQPVEQRRTIARGDFDDGKPARSLVIEGDGGRDGEGFRTRMAQGARGQLADQFNLGQQRFADALLETFDRFGFAERRAMLVLDQEIVDRGAVAGGVDSIKQRRSR